ncbi:MAG: hypothetical protein QM589_14580 [Thermomicrobiales bacterium]
MTMVNVLFVVSAADHWTLKDGTEHPTGYWGEELATPHRLFTEAEWGHARWRRADTGRAEHGRIGRVAGETG